MQQRKHAEPATPHGGRQWPDKLIRLRKSLTEQPDKVIRETPDKKQKCSLFSGQGFVLSGVLSLIAKTMGFAVYGETDEPPLARELFLRHRPDLVCDPFGLINYLPRRSLARRRVSNQLRKGARPRKSTSCHHMPVAFYAAWLPRSFTSRLSRLFNHFLELRAEHVHACLACGSRMSRGRPQPARLAATVIQLLPQAACQLRPLCYSAFRPN
jgi:hypothetical protein